MTKQLVTVQYSISLGGADLDEKTAGVILTDFIYRVYKYSPFFKVVDTDIKFYEYYQKGHLSADLGWRFFFSETLFKLFGGKIGDDEAGA